MTHWTSTDCHSDAGRYYFTFHSGLSATLLLSLSLSLYFQVLFHLKPVRRDRLVSGCDLALQKWKLTDCLIDILHLSCPPLNLIWQSGSFSYFARVPRWHKEYNPKDLGKTLLENICIYYITKHQPVAGCCYLLQCLSLKTHEAVPPFGLDLQSTDWKHCLLDVEQDFRINSEESRSGSSAECSKNNRLYTASYQVQHGATFFHLTLVFNHGRK